MRHRYFVWCPASAMTASICLGMLLEFFRVLWGNLLHDLMFNSFHACQVWFDLTREAQIYPSLCNASVASFSL